MSGGWVAAAITAAASLILWFVSRRRTDRATGELAERTVDAEVELKDIAAEDARLLSAAKAWEKRAEGLLSAIADRDQVIEWQRGELERRDDMLARREQVIATLRQRLDEVEGQLAACRRDLDALSDEEERSGSG